MPDYPQVRLTPKEPMRRVAYAREPEGWAGERASIAGPGFLALAGDFPEGSHLVVGASVAQPGEVLAALRTCDGPTPLEIEAGIREVRRGWQEAAERYLEVLSFRRLPDADGPMLRYEFVLKTNKVLTEEQVLRVLETGMPWRAP